MYGQSMVDLPIHMHADPPWPSVFRGANGVFRRLSVDVWFSLTVKCLWGRDGAVYVDDFHVGRFSDILR